MAAIPDDKIQEVRDRVDIVDLIGRYVDLKRSGRNYVGRCPFHQERTPSFNVNPALRGYKCFGCGVGGDSIRFVMEIEGKGFVETIRKLAEMYGVTLPASVSRGSSGPDRNERDDAYALMRTAAELYRDILLRQPEGEAGRAYLKTRGIGEDAAEAFRLGYAPAPTEAGWDRLAKTLQDKGQPIALATKLGLVRTSERRGSVYDSFRGRLMFPVVQPGGEVIAFSGRIVPPHDEANDGSPPPKYVNSSESFLFHKGKSLFGLAVARPAIRSSGRAILVEGNVDVVSLHQRGHGETIAPLGTALTEDQVRLLGRFTSQVVMCFDGDAAGRKAAWSALPLLLEQDLDVRLVLLPDGEDPDSLGTERFSNMLADARSALEVVMTKLAAKAGSSPDARARALDRAVGLIRRVRRPSARSFYAENAATLFRVPLDRISRALQENPRGPTGRSGPAVQPSATMGTPVPASMSGSARDLLPLPRAQAELTMFLVDLPHLATLAERNGALEHVADPRLRPVLQAVLDGAHEGRQATMDELLERVEPQAQPLLHQHVFAGKYRASEDEALDADPQLELQTLLHRCREEALDSRVRQLDAEYRSARDSGDLDRQRELSQLRISLRREQADLRHAAPAPPTP
ncbi:MAG: DNA primase [Nannocystaceae bacterium]